MKKIIFSNEFFNIEDTLLCGQIFRFSPYNDGYLVFSSSKCAYLCYVQDNTEIHCEDSDYDYFYHYFDLDRNYQAIYEDALNENEDILSVSARLGKGIRILNQDRLEMLFSFIVSQNNNIPRIKGIIEKLCAGLGEKKEFLDTSYYTFPSVEKMANAPLEFYKSIGLGYRAPYIKRLADDLFSGYIDFSRFLSLSSADLKKELISIYGVGGKVADCVMLFGFHRTDSFPVDTWIEKVYREDFNGELTDRTKISEWFVDKFGQNSGYYQQYLFYYKRMKKNNA